MPRIRSIHPEACDSEKLSQLSDSAERTFFRLLTQADDEGRGEDRPKLLASKLYPILDSKGPEEVNSDLRELDSVGLLTRYSVAGRYYYSIPTFHDWQKPRHPSPSRLPSPDETDRKPDANPGNPPGDYTDPPEPYTRLTVDLPQSSRKPHAGGGGGEGGGEGEGARRKRRSTSPLPDDWKPTSSHHEKAARLGVDAEGEAEAFRDHHLARDSRFADWDRAFHTWLNNTQKFGANSKPTNGQIPLRGGPVDEHGIGKAVM